MKYTVFFGVILALGVSMGLFFQFVEAQYADRHGSVYISIS